MLDDHEVQCSVIILTQTDKIRELFNRWVFESEASEDELGFDHFTDTLSGNQTCQCMIETFLTFISHYERQDRLLSLARSDTHLWKTLRVAVNVRLLAIGTLSIVLDELCFEAQ